MSPWFFVRMSRLVRNPPSKERIILVAVVLGIAATLFIVERYIGWPEWATVNNWNGRFGGGGLR